MRFLLDEHLRGPLWSAIQRHNARGQWPLDVARIGDSDDLPLGLPDPGILLWTERNECPLVSRDKSTLPDHLRTILREGITRRAYCCYPLTHASRPSSNS